MSSLFRDPWDLEREEEEQDLDIEQLRENLCWDDEGLAGLDAEDTSEYLDRRLAGFAND